MNLLFPGLRLLGVLLVALFGCQCSTRNNANSEVLVSVHDQKMALIKDGQIQKVYPVSTSKYGLGNRSKSNKTPIGRFQVAEKIGDRAPSGAVFKGRKRTGEVVRPDAPGRDTIVSRILHLRGTEWRTRNTYSRCIYIHGTPEERFIGQPVSYGCVRMTSRDVIDLYDRLDEGASVRITTAPLPRRGAAIAPAPIKRVERVEQKLNVPVDNGAPLPEVMGRPDRYAMRTSL